MRYIFTLVFVLGYSLLVFSQDFYNNENELHAPSRFVKHAVPAFMKDDVVSAYANTNISNNSAPQNEPSVMISRVDPNIVVAAWRDFRLGYESNIIRRIGYTYSWDGGTTWAASQLLPDPNPDHISQSDPVVLCDMDGSFYISSTSRQPVSNYNREMLLYKSVDNGQTFELHDIAVPGSGAAGEDKEWLFCDLVPSNDTYNQLMMVWKSFGPSYGIKFRKSEIGGSNWSETVEVSDYYNGQGANITTGINGEIIVAWKDDGIVMDRSLDGGETFGEDFNVSSYPYDNANSFPFLCTDLSDRETRGNIYLVWADNSQDYDDVWFQRSTDGGASWLPYPIRVNDASDYDQFWPVVRCDENGRVYVIYYDDRFFPGLYHTYIAWSDDAGDTWTNAPLSDETFYFNTPNSDVRFGDYIDLDVYAGKIIPVWTDDRSADDNQEIYTATVDIGTFVDEFAASGSHVNLNQNYPNPFNAATVIGFTLKMKENVRLSVRNSLGQSVEVLLDEEMESGYHEVIWNNKGQAGVYYYNLAAGKDNITRRMISIK